MKFAIAMRLIQPMRKLVLAIASNCLASNLPPSTTCRENGCDYKRIAKKEWLWKMIMEA